MTFKTCGKCQEEKPLEDFSLSRRRGKQSWCKSCANFAGRQNYQENKERYFSHAKNRDAKIDLLINSFKDRPCADCGIKYPPYVMDMDHSDPDTKVDGISAMRRRRMAIALIVQEMAKCDVICANCHRERTNTRNPPRYMKINMPEDR